MRGMKRRQIIVIDQLMRRVSRPVCASVISDRRSMMAAEEEAGRLRPTGRRENCRRQNGANEAGNTAAKTCEGDDLTARPLQIRQI